MKWTRFIYQPNLPLGEDGKRLTACKEHIALSTEAATEGMILLKNDNNLLPLKYGSRIALFGKASFDYVKGGGGSGDVTVSYTRNLYEGLKLQGENVQIFEELSDFYRDYTATAYKDGKAPGTLTEPEIPSNLLKKAKSICDTAIITICRFSGEGYDRKDDFYLSDEEKKMVDTVTSSFSNVIAVLNVGGMIDTTWFKDNDKIQSVLLMWQGGIEGGLACANLLCGKDTPSGKLTDTFAKSFNDYPSSEGFHESEDYVKYTEDIYVGYRYFETIPGKADRVNYPFGFGLSYTDFRISIENTQFDSVSRKLSICAKVENIGNYKGKEVVQIYFGTPSDRLSSPKKQLIAFKKTALLSPGENTTLHFNIDVNDMASYDDTGKIQKSAYVLESGTYTIYAGNNVRDSKAVYSFDLEKNVITKQLSEKLKPTRLEKRLLADGSYETLETGISNDPNECAFPKLSAQELICYCPDIRAEKGRDFFKLYPDDVITLRQVSDGEKTMDELIASLTDNELIDLLGGQPNTSCANTFGFGNLMKNCIPNVMTADGPAGLRIWPEVGVCTTAWPCATMLACTWNTELVELVGRAAACEVKENNIGVWLAPALNIHRNPLCGRNFEYYSEDPLISGKIGAAMVRGIQSMHIAATIKHFACNNKETNRIHSDSILSERAAREIYLKGFEIIVKEANPYVIMSAYNIINGHRTSECKELLTDILRDEWGFDGLVTSDWWNHAEQYKEILAGNDIKMGRGFPDRVKKALDMGLLDRKILEKSVRRLLELILKLD